jgi:radical SAM protein with 4Fe4S-binding SPASM domain
MIVQHDGEVCNCCEDMHGLFGLGNVYRSSLREVWYSERHVRIVTDLIAGRRERYALCRNCPLPPSAPAADNGKIAIAPRRYTGESVSACD